MGLFGTIFSKAINKEVVKFTAGIYAQNLYKWINDGQPIYDDKTFDYVRNGYFAVGAVYECIDLISKKIAACPRLVYEIKDETAYKKYKTLIKGDSVEAKGMALYQKSIAMEEVKIPRIEKLLTDPNDKQTGDEFTTFVVGMYMLLGNAFIYGNGADNDSKLWNEIFALPDLHIISGGMLEPIKAYYLNYQTDAEEYFPVAQVAHMKTFNPDYSTTGSQLYGVPSLRPYAMSLQRSKLGNKEANKQMHNGGTFGILAPKNKEDQFSKPQKEALLEKIQGSRRAEDEIARIMPSSVPLEWLQIGLPITDMELFKSIQLTDEDVYRGFHVPVQFRSTDGSTFNNLDTANRQFIYNAVAPIADRLADTMTRFICRPYLKAEKKKYVIEYDYASLPELAKDMTAITTWLEKSWDLTPNEKREIKGFGKSKEVGMDTIWVPSGLRPIEDAMISPEAFNNAFDSATTDQAVE